MANKAKHVRLPNGFGSIVKLNKPNLRNPYCARKTVGKTFDGKLIVKAIGYYKTYNDAYQALVLYNQNPYDLDANSITFTEVYKKWSDEYFRKLKNLSGIRSIESAFKYCTPLHKMRIKDIKVNHIRGTIYDSNISAAGKARMKSMLNLMFDWALERELVDKNYARILNIDDIHKRRAQEQKTAIPFSDKEIATLWEECDFIQFADMILIGIYSGWRPQELATLRCSDIDFENNIMKGGMKTDAGTNRIVPIHPKILGLIKKNYEAALRMNSDYLFNDPNGQQGTYMTYDKYRHRFDKVMDRLKMDHHPHETRHTFITKAKLAHVDEYAIKKIVGHTTSDITEAVYTHRDAETTVAWLREEILRIT